jgi:hypothetical protein
MKKKISEQQGKLHEQAKAQLMHKREKEEL